MIPVIGFVLLILPCVLSREHFRTSNGGICTSQCDLNGKSYYWCWQIGYFEYSWDYCSPAEKYDYQYNQCESACKSDGYSYTWCYLTQGSWGYCGHITEEFETRYTRYNAQCMTDCNKHGRYFRCFDSNDDFEYCSPFEDVTRKGEPCRENHACDSYGKSYTWCYTDENNNWDYCGKLTSKCEKSVYFSHRKKRAFEEEELCSIEGTENRITFEAIPENRLCRPNKKLYEQACHVIDRISPSTSISTGTIYTHNSVRLDLQGDFVREGVRYYNLQVQINGQRQGQSSVCQALIPVDLEPARFSQHIRRALHTSLQRVYKGDPVKVFVKFQPL